MVEFTNFILPDDVYYLILSHRDRQPYGKPIWKKIDEMTYDEVMQFYDEAVTELRKEIITIDDYYKSLEAG